MTESLEYTDYLTLSYNYFIFYQVPVYNDHVHISNKTVKKIITHTVNIGILLLMHNNKKYTYSLQYLSQNSIEVGKSF